MNVIHQLFFSFFLTVYLLQCLTSFANLFIPIQYAFCLISLALPMITVARTMMLIVIRVSDDTIKAVLQIFMKILSAIAVRILAMIDCTKEGNNYTKRNKKRRKLTCVYIVLIAKFLWLNLTLTQVLLKILIFFFKKENQELYTCRI